MVDTGKTEQGEGRRFWTPGMIAVCAALGLVVLLFLLLLALNYSARRAVDRELAKIRARGEPVTLDELAPPPVPDDENAAVVFEMAFAELAACESIIEADPDFEGWDYWPSAGPFEPELERTEKALQVHVECMRLTREALTKPKCRFDLDYSAGPGMELRHLARLRQLARLFRAQALVRAHRGRVDEAAESIVTILLLSRTLEEPLLIAGLVMIAIEGIGLDALKSVEKEIELSDGAKQRLIAALAGAETFPGLSETMIGERAFCADASDRMLAGQAAWLGGVPPRFAILARVFRFHFVSDKARVLRVMTEIVDASRLPPWEALPKTKEISHRIEAIPSWRAPLTRVLLPALSAAAIRFARMDARRGAAMLALAADLHRSAHGGYPDSLTALVPEFLPSLPPDPFTGKPFIYRKRADGKGFTVFSVGDNLTDDGGVFDNWVEGDIPWERKPPEETARAAPETPEKRSAAPSEQPARR